MPVSQLLLETRSVWTPADVRKAGNWRIPWERLERAPYPKGWQRAHSTRVFLHPPAFGRGWQDADPASGNAKVPIALGKNPGDLAVGVGEDEDHH
jgi:hypothetical protein